MQKVKLNNTNINYKNIIKLLLISMNNNNQFINQFNLNNNN